MSHDWQTLDWLKSREEHQKLRADNLERKLKIAVDALKDIDSPMATAGCGCCQTAASALKEIEEER